MSDSAVRPCRPGALQLRICQLLALRPTLSSLNITQAQLDDVPDAVLDYYAEQLIDFFCSSEPESRWRQLAQRLAHSLRQSMNTEAQDVIQAVLDYPDSGMRSNALGAQAPKVYVVRRQGCHALGIVRGETMWVYTLGQALEPVDATAKEQLLKGAVELEDDVFEGWALAALDGALQRIHASDLEMFPSVEQLDRQLAWATNLSDFFTPTTDKDVLRDELEQQLPDWLRNASSAGRLDYSKLLVAMASLHRRYRGKGLLDDSTEQPALFARCLALQLRRIALESSLRGLAGITQDGYQRLRAAVRTYATDRHVNDLQMVFKPLSDESGYLIGPSQGEAGPWLMYRPGNREPLQQVTSAPETMPTVTDPFAALCKTCGNDPTMAGWAESPLQTLARLRQVGGNLNSCQTGSPTEAWRSEVSLLRNLALLLVCRGTAHASEAVATHLRLTWMDAEWAGACPSFSLRQQQRLERYKRSPRVKRSPTWGERIMEGIDRGLHLLSGVLIFNKDENSFNVFSKNRFNVVLNLNVVEHQVGKNSDDQVHTGPYIKRMKDDSWAFSRSPRLKRDAQGLSVNAEKAMKRASSLSAEATVLLTELARPNELPVEIEECFERKALELEAAIAAIERYTKVRSTQASIEMIARLRRQADELRASGRAQRIEGTRTTPAPTMGDVTYLLAQGVIEIVRINGREEETIGGIKDYLQEYEVQDRTNNAKPLWYAHFHYSTREAADDGPTLAHLKTAAQRAWAVSSNGRNARPGEIRLYTAGRS
ncbi:hypothetical protein [Pseudomonas lactucae]|uniref:Uncharacterized protein n=1 Tax=Pseudomonas lactucae TaxID=2813360 RepID=A0A9X0YF66_9PSED|nr:hypothetical protein [Pseudomonas lactucae]MBN2978219.1 hypothetical protein [Pseudomonas lactucae]MBN2986500.1 hypothetical protein [Pseudomonas lactucae]